MQVSQEGTIRSLWWDDLIPDYPYVGRYQPRLGIELWELRTDALASEFYDYMAAAQNRNRGSTDTLTVEGADEARLSVGEYGVQQRLLLRCGNRVAYIDYYGAGTLAEHPDSFAVMLEADWRVPEYLRNREKGN